MPTCPHATPLTEEHIVCARLTGISGFSFAIRQGECRACVAQRNDTLPAPQCEFLRDIAVRHLLNRISISGSVLSMAKMPRMTEKAIGHLLTLTDGPMRLRLLGQVCREHHKAWQKLDAEGRKVSVSRLTRLAEMMGIPVSLDAATAMMRIMAKEKKPTLWWMQPLTDLPLVPCRYRSEQIEVRSTSCCGPVQVFTCSKLNQKVWETKCKRCAAFESAMPMRALVLPWGAKTAARKIIATLPKLGFEVKVIERGEGHWKLQAMEAVREWHPHLFVCWQRLYPGWGEELKKMLDEYQVCQLYLDFGVWPHYSSIILDPKADNAKSSITGRLKRLDGLPRFRDAADASKPELELMQRELRAKAMLGGGMLEEANLVGIPDDFVFVGLQRTGDSTLRFDTEKKRADPTRLALELIRESARQKRFIVLKQHPLDDKIDRTRIPDSGPYHRFMPRKCKDNMAVCGWLFQNARHFVTVNSSMHYMALALGCRVVTMGHGFFTGNDVTVNVKTLRAAIAGPGQKPDKAWVARYLLHMLSRCLLIPEFGNAAAVASKLNLIHRFGATTEDVTTVTCVYAPTKRLEDLTVRCLESVKREFPQSRRMVGVDDATPEFLKRMKDMGFEAVLPEPQDGPEPPRMARILERCIRKARTTYVMTVESDDCLPSGAARTLLGYMRIQPPDVAGIECAHVGALGRYPRAPQREAGAWLGDPNLLLVPRFLSWSATLWLRDALLDLPWASVPVFHRADVYAGLLLRKQGYKLLFAPKLVTDHVGRSSWNTMEALGRVPQEQTDWDRGVYDAMLEKR